MAAFTRLDHIGENRDTLDARHHPASPTHEADDPFRLGVHGPGSDIDTICVCPRHVFKDNFFGEFQQMLREWPAVTEISVRDGRLVNRKTAC